MNSREVPATRLLVVGSLNQDLVVRVPRHPLVGETIHGHSWRPEAGGKGANQAVAAARWGASVDFLGCIGQDDFGAQLLRAMHEAEIETSRIAVRDDVPTGVAVVTVDDQGENSIVVIGGANQTLTPSDIAAQYDAFSAADIVLVQLEIPLETVLATIRAARAAERPIVLDPAPALPLPADTLHHPDHNALAALFDVDILCPNVAEATALTGIAIQSSADEERAARALVAHGVRNAVITLGPRGAIWCNQAGECVWVPGYPVRAVDTTAAGDAFAAALAVRWCETRDLLESLRWANAAGALAVGRAGAQVAMPWRHEIAQMVSACSPHADTLSAPGDT